MFNRRSALGALLSTSLVSLALGGCSIAFNSSPGSAPDGYGWSSGSGKPLFANNDGPRIDDREKPLPGVRGDGPARDDGVDQSPPRRKPVDPPRRTKPTTEPTKPSADPVDRDPTPSADKPQRDRAPGSDKPQRDPAPGSDNPQRDRAPSSDKPQRDRAPSTTKPQRDVKPGTTEPQRDAKPSLDRKPSREPAPGRKPAPVREPSTRVAPR